MRVRKSGIFQGFPDVACALGSNPKRSRKTPDFQNFSDLKAHTELEHPRASLEYEADAISVTADWCTFDCRSGWSIGLRASAS
jgi:hypothetical protein